MLTLIALTVIAVFMMGFIVGFCFAQDIRPVIRPDHQGNATTQAYGFWATFNRGE